MLRTIRIFAGLPILLLGGIWAYAWVTRAPEEGLADAFVSRLGLLFGGQGTVVSGGGVQLPQGMSLAAPSA